MTNYCLPNLPAQTAFPISKTGYPFIFALAFITVIFALLDFMFLTVIFLFSTLFTCFFFRDPDRIIPDGLGAVVSPADGKVVDVSLVEGSPYLDVKCRKISIFMSIFNVHVNRSPFVGTVKRVEYYPGKYFSASLDKASEENERNAVTLAINNGVEVCFVQIAGLVARRIVCGVKPGDLLAKGQRFGLICFGSRLDVYVPMSVRICVRKGDKVQAGSSVIGELLDDS